MAKLAPSILSCDFSRLQEQLLAAWEGGAEIIHVDVMDGRFVPNLTFGPPIVEAVRKVLPHAFIDVHLMMDNPRRFIRDFAQAGADLISFHVEAVADFDAVLQDIARVGKKGGLALCPGTPLSVLEYVLEKVSLVLLLTVNPGFGGQKFIPGMEEKIRTLRKMIKEKGLQVDIAIDGGVKEENIEFLAACGASIIVAGSLVFTSPDIRGTVRRLTEMIRVY
ncbi:MAG: ribulose-phosphate 3-epimerase [Candidatus Caldatribacterium sp.]|nr:ribulose-phosphate 3-epimerase [Candidatus Caldatribacterium sp.]